MRFNFVAARRSGVVLLNYGRKDSRATESPVLQGGVVYNMHSPSTT